MTNVPGFIPKPYPIVTFPGTFVIILERAAVEFFRIMKLIRKTSTATFGKIVTNVPGKITIG